MLVAFKCSGAEASLFLKVSSFYTQFPLIVAARGDSADWGPHGLDLTLSTAALCRLRKGLTRINGEHGELYPWVKRFLERLNAAEGAVKEAM